MIGLQYRLRRSVAKTVPDLARLASGGAPPFIYGGSVDGLPVFTYHAVGERFLADLEFLAAAGYRTADAAMLAAWICGEIRPDGRTVALTFDDGLACLTDVAVPALRRHGFRGIAFVVGGLVPARKSGRLTGWEELNAAVRDGVLEVGAHSSYHNHVSIAPKRIGFVTPQTDTRFEANIPVPRRSNEPIPLGAPFLLGRPRYTTPRAFVLDPAVWQAYAQQADDDPSFFDQAGWQRRLGQGLRIEGRFETEAEGHQAIVEDMQASIRAVVDHVPNRAERFLCYPWYAGNGMTDRLAREAGVELAFLGVDRRSQPADGSGPHRIGRIPEEWITALPGPNRTSFRQLLTQRLAGLVGR